MLHGGGNTSIKGPYLDITGVEIDALFVKGSGWDLATIAAAGFTPLRLSRLTELLDLDAISDQEMMRELSAARLDPAAAEGLLPRRVCEPEFLASRDEGFAAAFGALTDASV